MGCHRKNFYTINGVNVDIYEMCKALDVTETTVRRYCMNTGSTELADILAYMGKLTPKRRGRPKQLGNDAYGGKEWKELGTKQRPNDINTKLPGTWEAKQKVKEAGEILTAQDFLSRKSRTYGGVPYVQINLPL